MCIAETLKFSNMIWVVFSQSEANGNGGQDKRTGCSLGGTRSWSYIAWDQICFIGALKKAYYQKEATHPLHVVPVSDVTTLDGTSQLEDTSLAIGIFSNKLVVFTISWIAMGLPYH